MHHDSRACHRRCVCAGDATARHDRRHRPLRQQRRQQRRGERGGDHAAAHRGSAAAASRQSARIRARHGRDAAQRRRARPTSTSCAASTSTTAPTSPTWVAGMPVNLRTHGHGQGYTDLNFLIPELIARVDYFKGPYYAEHRRLQLRGRRVHALLRQHEGRHRRSARAATTAMGARCSPARRAAGHGRLTYGLEYLHNDGPWEVPDDFRKVNAILRYVMPVGDGKLGLHRDGVRRQVELDRPGREARRRRGPDRPLRHARRERRRHIAALQLLASTTAHRSPAGSSRRRPTGSSTGSISSPTSRTSSTTPSTATSSSRPTIATSTDGPGAGRNRPSSSACRRATRSASSCGRTASDPVGLYSTRERERLSITREDNVTEGSAGVYAQNDTQWNDWFRSILGIRYDWYRFNVDSIVPENSGNVTSGIASPKASLVFGPWDKTEYFVNAGYGFHSNDARGVTIRVDPKTGDPVDPATPLVRSKGAELGTAHRGDSERPVVARALVPEARQRAGVRRRRRHHRSGAAVAALRRRMEHALAAAAVDVRRPRPRMESRAFLGRRAGRRLHSRRA